MKSKQKIVLGGKIKLKRTWPRKIIVIVRNLLLPKVIGI